jgi:non-heme chloroperoxidase
MPRFVTSDETELFYRDWGSGCPVVFAHAMPLNGDTWRYQMLHLASNGFRAVACDRRGHGRSDDPGRGYDFDTLADDLAMLLERLDLTGATLVGHSMGGAEVTRYLTRHGSARVARIALVGSTALSFGDGLPGCVIPQLDREQATRDWMGVSLNAVVACMSALMRTDFSAELARVTVPALVVHGDRDAVAPLEPCGRRAAELISDSRLVVYANEPHMIHLSHRDRLNADLLSFARQET